MIYRFALCDDDPAALAYVSGLARDWARGQGCGAEIAVFPSAEAFMFRYAEDKAYDLLLLDIEMGRMNGVELARLVRAENRDIQIIFITGYTDYIADGYDVEALHYLVKPVNAEKLIPVLDRAADRLRRNERALLIATRGETERIPLVDIRYVESRQNYSIVHAENEHSVKKPLGEIEKALGDGFFRMGRSYVVSLSHIRKITRGSVFLSDGTELPLPRGMYEPLNRAFIAYF